MSTMLCMAATHLSILRPDDRRYRHIAMQLLIKSVQLFRKNLSLPITAQNGDALMGTSLMIHYLAWSNIQFLDEQPQVSPSGAIDDYKSPGGVLDISQDQLFLLSAGVQQVFKEALPHFWLDQSDFVGIALYSPRNSLEEVARRRDEDPYRFTDAFMRVWDDPRFQTAEITTYETSDPYFSAYLSSPKGNGTCIYQHIKTLSNELAVDTSPPFGPQLLNAPPRNRDELACDAEIPRQPGLGNTAPGDNKRPGFERASRRLSLLLSFLSLAPLPPLPTKPHSPEMNPSQADFERYIFAFPVVASGPFLELALRGDVRTLVILFHFYRAARLLLTARESWWAKERSRVLEGLILGELKARGLGVCLRGDGN